MEGEAWWATGHGVAKSWTRLSNLTFTFTSIPYWLNYFPGVSWPQCHHL